ncbi:MAG: YceD family protein [Firmicutes bacterium]|nr:YceD family protein [Bacillota bacterium]
MEVRVSDVKKWAGREETTEIREAWPEVASSRVGYPLTDPAVIRVLVRNTGGGRLVVEIHGTLEAEAVCTRCAEPFHLSLPFEATEEFREEPGPYDENLDYGRYTGDKINLDVMVSDAAGASVPIAVLCRPDCQGLCPICGTNRNVATCACRSAIDERWTPLNSLTLSDDTRRTDH